MEKLSSKPVTPLYQKSQWLDPSSSKELHALANMQNKVLQLTQQIFL